jgi:hypothetical protein
VTASSSSGDVPALTIRRDSPAVVPNQAAFPDTARLLPVMVPALARASRSAGLLDAHHPCPG